MDAPNAWAPRAIAARLSGTSSGRLVLRLAVVVVVAAVAVVLALGQQRPLATRAAGPTVECGTLATATWNAAGSPYQLCAGGATVPAGVTITLDGSGGPVAVNAGSGGILTVSGGNLVTASTTVTNRFTFTGPTTTAGSWQGIYSTSGGVVNLSNVTISYGQYGVQASTSGATTLASVAIDHTAGNGVYVYNGNLSISSSTVNLAGDSGVWFQPTIPAQAAVISGNTITNSTNYGIVAYGATNPKIVNNTVSTGGTAGLVHPAIYLLGGTFDLGNAVTGVSGNQGHGNGLDAIAFYGTDLGSFGWLTPTNTGVDHPLGYLGTGALTLSPSTTLTVPQGAVVKFASGQIVAQGATVDATDVSGGNAMKIFTTFRDPSGGLATCPSVFISSTCGTLSNDWGGIYMSTDGGTSAHGRGAFNNARIRYSNGDGLHIDSGATTNPAGGAFGLSVVNSVVDSSTSYAVEAYSTPVSVTGTTLSNSGARGMYAYAGNLVATTDNVTNSGGDAGIWFQASAPSNTLTLSGNLVSGGNGYGVVVYGATLPVVTNNTISLNGAGATKYPALYVPGGSFDLGNASTGIGGNQGHGNGLDAIAISGTDVGSFTWVSPTNSGVDHALGYLGVSTLTLSPSQTLSFPQGSVVKFGSGGITANGATIDASDVSGGNVVKTFTTLRDGSVGPSTCPSVLVSTSCGILTNDWSGFYLTTDSGSGQHGRGAFNNAAIKYSGSDGIHVDSGAVTNPAGGAFGLSVVNTTIDHSGGYGIEAYLTPITVTGSTISNSTSRGIYSYAGNLVATTDSITSNVGDAGIWFQTAGSQTATISSNTISGNGGYGIVAYSATQPAIINNTLNLNGAGGTKYAAIYVPGGTFDLGNASTGIAGNHGQGNGLDAVAFYGTDTGSFSWISPTNSGVDHALGYLANGTLTLTTGQTMTVPHGAVVKFNGGSIQAVGATVDAGDTSGGNAVKTFTTFRDGTVGPSTCPSIFVSSSCGVLSNDWGGIYMSTDGVSGAHGRGTFNTSTIKYSSGDGLHIDSTAVTNPGGGAFGLTVVNSTIDHSGGYGIEAYSTPISVTGSTISATTSRGIYAYAGNLVATGNSITGTAGDAGLWFQSSSPAQTVTISSNVVSGGAGYGIVVYGANLPVVTSNTLNGNGAGAGAGKYSAMYLQSGTFDLSSAVTGVGGNHGQGNGLDAVALYGTEVGSFTWATPTNSGVDHPLGYLVTSGLTLNPGVTMSVPQGSVVKVLSGTLSAVGATIDASDSSGGNNAKYFTTFRDPVGIATCPSVFVSSTCLVPTRDWGGINISFDSGSSSAGRAAFEKTTVRNSYGDGIYISSGATTNPAGGAFGLSISESTIDQVGSNSINASQTPIRVTNSTLSNATSHGINTYQQALTVTGSIINSTGDTGIYSNTPTPAVITGNTITGAAGHGISLLSVTGPTVTGNTISGSGAGGTIYSAINITGTFDLGNTGTGGVANNVGHANGLDAVTFNGTDTGSFSWITPTNDAVNSHPLGYLPSGTLTLSVGTTLTLPQGSVMKFSSGTLASNGAVIDATDVSGPNNPKILTTWRDPVSVVTCPTFLVGTSCGNTANQDWSGVDQHADSGSGTTGSAAFYNTTIRNTYSTGIYQFSGAIHSPGNAGYGLQFVNGSMTNVAGDAIYSSSPMLVAGSTFDTIAGQGVHTSAPGAATIQASSFSGIGGGNAGYYAVNASSGSAVVTCSSIHGNADGLYSGSTLSSIVDSDLYNNSGTSRYDLFATAGSVNAGNNWWGQAGGPVAGQVNNLLMVNPASPAGAQHATVAITLDDTSKNTNGNFGAGTLSVALVFSRSMNQSVQPTVTFAGPDTTVHNVTGSWADATHWNGLYSLSGGTSSSGANTLNVSAARGCVPDPSSNLMVPNSKGFTVDATGTPSATTSGPTAPAGCTSDSSEVLNGSANALGWSPATASFDYGTSPGSLTSSTTPQSISGSSPTAITATLTSLTPFTTYYYRLTATGPNGSTHGNTLSFTLPVTPTAVSSQQYHLSGSNGFDWQEIDPTNLRICIAPNSSTTAILGANADLWTANSGFNQDIGIFVSVDGAPASSDTLVAWKESGGFAGTFSPNAAYVHTLYDMTATHQYTFKVKWKTNKPTSTQTIYAAAGGTGNFSPSRLTARLVATGSAPATRVLSAQRSLSGSNGTDWQEIDSSLAINTGTLGANTSGLLSANSDLWTANAGYNQDIGIFVGVDGAPADTLVAWKESGGFAGTFSPNAAFVQGAYNMLSGHNYTYRLKWKTNKNASGATIFAGAGSPGNFSPTRLTLENLPTSPYQYTSASNQQYTLSDSTGTAWTEIDPANLRVSITPSASGTAILGANVDLFTATAGYNQDIGVWVSVDGAADQLVGWKESGGFAGTFSPNAAFSESAFPVSVGHNYVFKLKWKTNKPAGGVTIFAGAGSPGNFSPTRMTLLLAN